MSRTHRLLAMNARSLRTRATIAISALIMLVQATGIVFAQPTASSGGNAISKTPRSDLLLAARADPDVVSAPTEARRGPHSPDARGLLGAECLLIALLLLFALLISTTEGPSSRALRATRSRAPPSFVF